VSSTGDDATIHNSKLGSTIKLTRGPGDAADQHLWRGHRVVHCRHAGEVQPGRSGAVRARAGTSTSAGRSAGRFADGWRARRVLVVRDTESGSGV